MFTAIKITIITSQPFPVQTHKVFTYLNLYQATCPNAILLDTTIFFGEAAALAMLFLDS